MCKKYKKGDRIPLPCIGFELEFGDEIEGPIRHPFPSRVECPEAWEQLGVVTDVVEDGDNTIFKIRLNSKGVNLYKKITCDPPE